MDAGRSVLSAWPALWLSLAGALMTLTGLAIAGPALAVPGAGLLALGVLAPVWVLTACARVRLQARPLDETVIDGQQLRLAVSIPTGPARLGLGDGVLWHELALEPVALGPRGTRTDANGGNGRLILNLTARGRGRLILASPQLRLGDPLGLARAERSGEGRAGMVLVLPATEPVRWIDDDELRAVAGGSAGRAAGVPSIDIAGLRDYQPGTPATRIHWPALARGGDLLERVFETETPLAPVIVLDVRTNDPDRLDAVIRASASLILALALARRGSVDLALPGRGAPLRITSSLSTWPAALRALALVDATDFDAAAPRIPVGVGALFYACSDPELAAGVPARWPGRLLILAPAPAGLTPPGAVLEVAGCAAWPAGSRT